MNKAFCFLVLITALLLLTSCTFDGSSQNTETSADTSLVQEEMIKNAELMLEQIKTNSEYAEANWSYPYLENVISGKIGLYEKRLTLEQVKDIIRSNPDSFEDIRREIEKVQPYVDRSITIINNAVANDSGTLYEEMWFDDYGNEGIKLYTPGNSIEVMKTDGESIVLFRNGKIALE